MTGTTAGTVTSSTKAAKATPRPRNRSKLGKVPRRPPPIIKPVMHTLGSDGRLAVLVPLQGSRGSGKHMTVDEVDWTRVSAAHGTRWGLREVKKGYSYVTSMGPPTAGLALARVVTRAPEGTVVGFRNGNALDFSRSNLVVMGVSEARERAFTRKGKASAPPR